MDLFFLISSGVKIAVITFGIILPMVALCSLAERKVSAFIQDRIGPNRVGLPMTLLGAKKDIPFFGLVQPLADGLKFILKEDFTPKHVNKFYFWLAPALVLVPALLTVGVIPVLMIFGELNLGTIVRFQDQNGWLLLPLWGHGLSLQRWLLLLPLLISFIIFTVSIFAETNRAPFDLPECETELVAGYHTEYSSMKFALFFLGEYAAMIVGSALIVTLFLGGWSIPFGDKLGLGYQAAQNSAWIGLLHLGCFLTKVIAFIFFFMWVRWTLPRFRYDQLMRLGWIFFFEIALFNVFLTAGILMLVK